MPNKADCSYYTVKISRSSYKCSNKGSSLPKGSIILSESSMSPKTNFEF